MFPEMKANWSKLGYNLGFHNKNIFQMDPESLPEHDPTFLSSSKYVFDVFKGMGIQSLDFNRAGCG